MPYIEQDDTSVPEPFRCSSMYELEFEGYADGEFMQVTVAFTEDLWELFKKNVVNA